MSGDLTVPSTVKFFDSRFSLLFSRIENKRKGHISAATIPSSVAKLDSFCFSNRNQSARGQTQPAQQMAVECGPWAALGRLISLINSAFSNVERPDDLIASRFQVCCKSLQMRGLADLIRVRFQVFQVRAGRGEPARGLIREAISKGVSEAMRVLDSVTEPKPDRCPRCGSDAHLSYERLPNDRGRRVWLCGKCWWEVSVGRPMQSGPGDASEERTRQ